MSLKVYFVWIFMSLTILLTLAEKDSNRPVINIILQGYPWQNLSIPLNPPGTVLYHEEFGDNLIVTCTAPYPVRWNFEGFLQPRTAIKVEQSSRDLYQETFKLTAKMWFYGTSDAKQTGYSFSLSCLNETNQETSDVIYFITRGNGATTIVHPNPVDVHDSLILPCATTNPTLNMSLYSVSQAKTGLVSETNISYNPVQGFRSNKVFIGEFACRQDQYTKLITASVSNSNQNKEKTRLQPKVIMGFSDEPLYLKCHAGKYSRLQFDYNNSMLSLTTDEADGVYIAKVTSKVSGSLNGTVKCLVFNDVSTDPATADLWKVQFIDPPEMLLDDYSGYFQCLSSVSPRSIMTRKCTNPADCEFKEPCINNEQLCEYESTMRRSTDETRCIIPPNESKDCVAIEYSHYHGLVTCQAKGLYRSWYFFTSLENFKYTNWQDARPEELLRLDDVSPILYTNNTNNFTCTSTAFLFSPEIYFEIIFENGTTSLLKPNNATINIRAFEEWERRYIRNFNHIAVLSIKLPLDAVGIYCIAPWGNSSDVMKISKNFSTKDLLPSNFENDIKNQGKEIFYIGDKTGRLICPAKGEPRPEYTWLFNDKNVSWTFPGFKTSIETNGYGNLNFPRIEKNLEGIYTCIAKNRAGFTTKTFTVDVKEKSAETAVGIYVGVSVSSITVLLLFAVLFVVYKRKYNSTRKLLRSLTEAELDEFFLGRPELVEDMNTADLESVELLPYKNHFEIPFQELELDTSDTGVLGSGQYARVLRGKLKSSGREVAVKISKATYDISLFKALLSEIKIMMYLGSHPNIIDLVGVCTEDIRSRNIHIAIELCDLGALSSYLRNSKHDFTDLFNNQRALKTTSGKSILSESKLSTLDLFNFATQIASGMAYLSTRSIVHADLAARNILLTDQKIAKVSDFGLSKQLYHCSSYVKTTQLCHQGSTEYVNRRNEMPLPWRWMAVETLKTLTFTVKSDVWSYGATLYEIFTLGAIPFPSEHWSEEFVNKLSTGMRMGRPEFSDPNTYSLIVSCWENDPEMRPDFQTCAEYFHGRYSELTHVLTKVSNPNSTSSAAYCNLFATSNAKDAGERIPLKNRYQNINC